MATVQYRRECSLVLLKEEIKARDLSLLESVLRVVSLSINKRVWVDCGQVAAIPPEALGRVLSLSRRAEALGVNLLFCQVRPSGRACPQGIKAGRGAAHRGLRCRRLPPLPAERESLRRR